jgi:hypothetical protein
LQRDRIAVNERRREPSDHDPSSKTVWPELERLAGCVNKALVEEVGYGPSIPTVVEVTYVNRVDPVAGVWETHSELHFSRRVSSQTEDLALVFEACHRDGVSGFAAVTMPEMHEFWKRTR